MEIEISDAEIIRSLSNTDIYLLLLLGAENNTPLTGKTICQMEMFLLTRTNTFVKQVMDIDFEWSEKYGPYSEYLSNSLHILISYMLVKRGNRITLTEKGVGFYNHILEIMSCSKHKAELEAISKVKKQFSTYNRHELMGYITLHYARDFT